MDAAIRAKRPHASQVESNGYADPSGALEKKQEGTLKRAKSVTAELIKDGVPKDAITTQGFGNTNGPKS
jgi:OOP family OmpA-OmpF porin